jgi:hypothetical protein
MLDVVVHLLYPHLPAVQAPAPAADEGRVAAQDAQAEHAWASVRLVGYRRRATW